jgi:hypothetical protein
MRKLKREYGLHEGEGELVELGEFDGLMRRGQRKNGGLDD